MRLIRSQESAGNWPGCIRSLVIRRFPRNPSDVHQIHFNGAQFDAHQLFGEPWKEARMIQFILGDGPLLVADALAGPRRGVR